MTRNKILICGATGFIGRNLLNEYAGNNEYDVHAVYHNRVPSPDSDITWHYCDLTDSKQVEALFISVKPNKVIQAAATTSGSKDIVENPSVHVTDNVVMNSFIFKSAVACSVDHLIFFSCTVMYRSSSTPIKEDAYDANLPVHPKYFGAAHTKLYLEKMCEFFSSLGQTKFTAIRHSNIYGPHDKFDLEKSHFFGATINKVLTSESEVVIWGSGEEKRDLLYVSDLVDFVGRVFQFQKPRFRIYHCGSSEAVSVNSVVKAVISASGKELKIKHDRSKPNINTSLCLDTTRAKAELGWKPTVHMSKGIEKTLLWFKANYL